MAQHDYVINNAAGLAVRGDINNSLEAVASANSGATEPSTTYPYQEWADTTSGKLKRRSGDNSAWIEVGSLADANMGLLVASNNLSDVTAPSALVNLGITATAAEVNILDGVTATTSELNIIDGVTATTSELNILDGVTASASELNKLDGATATTNEINVLDMSASGSTSGQVLTSNGTSSTPTWGAASVIAQVKYVQTRAQTTYAATTSGDGTVITELSITLTPQKAGNIVILDWQINGEADEDIGFIVTREDTKLTDATNSANNRWAVITTSPYDANDYSTPVQNRVRIVDTNSLGVSSTYKVLARMTSSTAKTLYLNRTEGGTGADSREALLSSGVATEINT
jgi:hypothetical protein